MGTQGRTSMACFLSFSRFSCTYYIQICANVKSQLSGGQHAAAVPPPSVAQPLCLCNTWFRSSARAAGLHQFMRLSYEAVLVLCGVPAA
eukprot:1136779-Pelagomonas_calceolata.AAC.1